jgi:hypothetical protein
MAMISTWTIRTDQALNAIGFRRGGPFPDQDPFDHTTDIDLESFGDLFITEGEFSVPRYKYDEQFMTLSPRPQDDLDADVAYQDAKKYGRVFKLKEHLIEKILYVMAKAILGNQQARNKLQQFIDYVEGG